MGCWKKGVGLLVALAVMTALVACTSTSTTKEFSTASSQVETKKEEAANSQQANKEAVTLCISAAASLKNVCSELADLYQEKQKASEGKLPLLQFEWNFASSGKLQQQIEEGAPVDIFFSAGKKQVKALEDKGLVLEGSTKDFVKNALVLVTPKGKPIAAEKMEDLGKLHFKLFAIGEESVPAGQYAREALNYYKLREQLMPKANLAPNVRAVLAWVEEGGVDFGFVYATDAKQSQAIDVQFVVPEESHRPIVYPLCQLKASAHQAENQAFLTFLSSEEATGCFARYGFERVQP